jgi:hypothetical protein
MRLKFNAFSGMIPKFSPFVLPDSNSENAVNCRFESGILQPLYGLTEDETLALTGHNINAIHLWNVNDEAYWLRFADKVNVIRSSIADDAYSRIYWSGDTRMGGSLLYSYTPAVYTGGGSEYPINYYKLGIPAPTQKPTTTLVGTLPDDVSASARSYVYTYMGKLGEESAPSPPSDPLICPNAGATVNVASIVIDVSADTGREIEAVRLYRSIVGSTGNADYLFVTEIPRASLASLPYVDNAADDALAESLTTTLWDEPREDMYSLGLTAYGVAYAAVGKIVCLSEPFVPYAWPRNYELTCDNDVVAIGHYDNALIVGTTGRPVMITGQDPQNMSQTELPISEACVSARSMVSMGSYAIYASPNGLILAAAGDAKLITGGIISNREWTNYKPDSIHAYQHRGKYIFFWKKDSLNKGGVIFDPRNPNDGLIAFNQYFVAGYRNEDTDTLYLIDENKVLWKFDDNNALPRTYTWKSKRISLDSPHCFTAARILADSYTNITINIYADNTLYHTQTVTNKSPFRLPRNGRYRVWQIEVIGTDNIREVAISETVTELQV